MRFWHMFAEIFTTIVFLRTFSWQKYLFSRKYVKGRSKCARQFEKTWLFWQKINSLRGNRKYLIIFAKMKMFWRFSRKRNFAQNTRNLANLHMLNYSCAPTQQLRLAKNTCKRGEGGHFLGTDLWESVFVTWKVSQLATKQYYYH